MEKSRQGTRKTLALLSGTELYGVISVVVLVYGGFLACLHVLHPSLAGSAMHEESNFWGTLPSAWDHPEPNYIVSGAIGEFWSVLTAIPVAGAALLYQGVKYQYGRKVIFIYVLTCAMYSLAFSAHLTLQKAIFSTTVTAVMSNALLTFFLFSHVVHYVLATPVVRGFIVLVAEVALVTVVATLPYALEANGGVWTLFIVQAPGVFLATLLAALLANRARSAHERAAYGTVKKAGCFLSAAMVLSFIECLVGFQHGYIDRLYGFPWLHIMIHVSEQIGIYFFGVGVACLHELLLRRPARLGAELVGLGFGVSYLYCPSHRVEQQAGVSTTFATTDKADINASLSPPHCLCWCLNPLQLGLEQRRRKKR